MFRSIVFVACVSASAPAAAQMLEVRGGLGVHDPGVISVGDENGLAGNAEILFDSPAFLEPIWSPRPQIGANFALTGGTNQFYAGLAYEWDITKHLFAGFSVGGATHTGDLDNPDRDEAALGTRVLFRQSVVVGLDLEDMPGSVSLMFDHSSNAFIDDDNEGLDTIQLRYGYGF